MTGEISGQLGRSRTNATFDLPTRLVSYGSNNLLSLYELRDGQGLNKIREFALDFRPNMCVAFRSDILLYSFMQDPQELKLYDIESGTLKRVIRPEDMLLPRCDEKDWMYSYSIEYLRTIGSCIVL